MASSRGTLFSEYYLSEGVATASDWESTFSQLDSVRAQVTALLDDFAGRNAPGEAETESDLVEPLLHILGWTDFLPQIRTSARGRTDVPDYLLFTSESAKAAATILSPAERYRQGAAIVEVKAWEIQLDKASKEISAGAPSTQILRYLSAVEAHSSGSIRFGMLTNGRVWRLYDVKASSRLEGFVEIDLYEAVERVVVSPDSRRDADHLLRLFMFLFGKDGFRKDAGQQTRLVQALRDSKGFEGRVTEALAATVFENVFPSLANAISSADPDRPKTPSISYLNEVRDAALTWLYRLLFVLYAEDRSLLPTRARRDGLWALRNEVARAIDNSELLSSSRRNYDGDLRDLWTQIDLGDEDIGLPPYNGGLFRQGRSELLDRSLISDADFAPLLDALSRERIEGRAKFINYRDLSVQHLGSVYERLLEFDLAAADGLIVTRPQAFARKTSGSYYTPEDLVMLVIRRTVGPLVAERKASFETRAHELQRGSGSPEQAREQLSELDPAARILQLRICDPAMGSGHFLVSLVDFLADEVLKATDEAAELASWADYSSPLLTRLISIRSHIMSEARLHGWAVHDEQLIDRQLVRRIILKRVIHGVDKNPMAVELAKLSLWLHTFTVGAPLSFLDHHLRCGDSLFGEWVRPALDTLAGRGLFGRDAVLRAAKATQSMQRVEELSDADITEVRASRSNFAEVSRETADAHKLLSLLQGWRWIGASTESARKEARKLRREADAIALRDPKGALRLGEASSFLARRVVALDRLLEGEFGDINVAIDNFYGRVTDPDPAVAQLAEARSVAETTNFLHWEIDFPGVWSDWTSDSPEGGFDAVIGNPPWDRLKMQDVEWFAAREPEVAYATRASDRKRMVEALRKTRHPVALDYERASRHASMAARMAALPPEKGGQYPLLGGGDVNLYSLFVERAERLVAKDGLVGLLVPSGIAGDLGASTFFRSISTTGRLSSLLDFANKPTSRDNAFFEGVDSRFKFSALIFGGTSRTSEQAECGFFLVGTSDQDLASETFRLSPADFAAVNPNSGTAPVFRNRRDAALITGIYKRIPILVDHNTPEPERPWKVRYRTMFHMTNDSDKFRTAEELANSGWYQVEGGYWRKGIEEAVPLYTGRMFNQFDHRAAGVEVNEENLHNPALSDRASTEQKADPSFKPSPQFWVKWSEVEPKRDWCLAFRDIARPTDVRTIIAAVLPKAAYGNKAPLLLTADAQSAALLLANLNSFALDFVARSKIQSANANWYIMEQLPILTPNAYDRSFGHRSASEIVTEEVLALTYTAHDLAEFARDMDYLDETGDVRTPILWNDEDRRQRRARLDALYFHLYGLSPDDAHYVLSTFPIVRRKDELEHGHFVTRDLIIGHMRALQAGDSRAIISSQASRSRGPKMNDAA
ncbi:BREX-1 system adenine-specific DNA-methyltransferase PglX [Sphingomonas sp. SM33]|uniref:site-specific DNA-methyltransferase (adenine-specific) n=1 Tax=Sphingomonas telluris TaxID=2907998 RepID=A0ABS9VN04_9SPHN|nr:BREX-1 system adenine-specific DNA-methyltransferase PglX [Sphingomonas telluris]MCH8616350.1 BREX-1 system adenine-specific DNA-methyltransferase PglX [Sphingomonas telluris]